MESIRVVGQVLIGDGLVNGTDQFVDIAMKSVSRG
jgi:hypothetical protein